MKKIVNLLKLPTSHAHFPHIVITRRIIASWTSFTTTIITKQLQAFIELFQHKIENQNALGPLETSLNRRSSI